MLRVLNAGKTYVSFCFAEPLVQNISFFTVNDPQLRCLSHISIMFLIIDKDRIKYSGKTDAKFKFIEDTSM